MTAPAFSLSMTHVHTFTPTGGDEPYQISVALPPAYPMAGDPFLALYVLDANLYMGMVIEMSRLMATGGVIPQTVVIGTGPHRTPHPALVSRPIVHFDACQFLKGSD